MKFLNPNGSLFLIVLLEASHLCLAADKAYYLISWKYSFPSCMIYVYSGPNWPTTPIRFMNCLCWTKRCKDFVASPLTHKSMSYSCFLKVLWGLTHFIWLVAKEIKALNWISPMKGPRLLSKSSSKKKLCMYNSHRRHCTYSLCSLKHLTKSGMVLISTDLLALTALTFNKRYLSSKNSA